MSIGLYFQFHLITSDSVHQLLHFNQQNAERLLTLESKQQSSVKLIDDIAV